MLRSENGCPWDKVQTHKSIRKDFLEETYEVLDAIDCESPEMLREELGDVLLQVVFHADIEKDEGRFNLDDIADDVCKKLILRHPHVFSDVKADTVDKVLSNWDAIKKDEKHQESYTDTLKSVPKVFPSLMRGQKLGKRAARAEIDFSDEYEAISAAQNILSEIEKKRRNGGDTDVSEEIGRLLMTCANLARKCDTDAEESLAAESDRFIERFEQLELGGADLSCISADKLYNV